MCDQRRSLVCIESKAFGLALQPKQLSNQKLVVIDLHFVSVQRAWWWAGNYSPLFVKHAIVARAQKDFLVGNPSYATSEVGTNV